MDDLQAVTRALVDNKKEHHVLFFGDDIATVFGSFVNTRFERNSSGSWDLTGAIYDRRPETITGLLDSIRGA